ncbi:protealysin inhibitor emfourin, partial [Desertihabitans aurantiacus]|uniref:protealysin inhibitor emfourin n=1 Tax=Desertihabitans aurantiacus TaxID=2282477 RepID=UPI00130060B4
PAPRRTVHDAENGTSLPGRVAREEGAPATGDAAVDEAYDGFGATWQLFWDAFGRDSLDGAGLPLLGTVHYDQNYDNAFWDGTQMVFGDGDGEVFQRFTLAVDVIGHELTHGVIDHTAALVYRGQSGALNESIADVFGALVRQRLLGHSAEQADWLIGAELFTDQVQGVALRSMAAPGTAYDDDVLGKDPQPGSMADYVETTDDNGGVHINSGIPNRAFHLAATAIGGNAWEAAGQIWYDVLTGGELAADCDFTTFADLTRRAAVARFGEGSAEVTAVARAWQEVGVTSTAAPGEEPRRPVPLGPEPSEPVPAPDPEPGEPVQPPEEPPIPTGPPEPAETDAGRTAPDPGTGPVELTRSGGLVGSTRRATFVPDELDPPDSEEWRTLLSERSFWTALPEPEPQPDAFVYRLVAVRVEVDVTFSERELPEPVRGLVHRTIQRGS